MNTYARKRMRLVPIVLALIALLITSCQITVVPLRGHDLLRPREKAIKLLHRHHAKGEATVEATLTQYMTALNAIFAGDVEPMTAVWSHADDVTYMGPDGEFRQGWAAVLADWQAQADQNLGGNVEAKDVHIVTRHGLAVVHKNVEGANLDADGNEVDVSLRATVVMRKEAGAWKVIGVHTDTLPNLQN